MGPTGPAGGDLGPGASDLGVGLTVDRYLTAVDPEIRKQFKQLLLLFEHGPLLFAGRAARFTELSPKDQDGYLESWRTSGLAFRRQGFSSIKVFALLGYYSHPETHERFGEPEVRACRVVAGEVGLSDTGGLPGGAR